MDFTFISSVAFEIASTLLLFALITSCRAIWPQNNLIALLPILYLMGVLLDIVVVKPPRYNMLGHSGVYLATLPIYVIGFVSIAWRGRRLDGKQMRAADWPRMRIVAAFAICIAGFAITFTNFPS